MDDRFVGSSSSTNENRGRVSWPSTSSRGVASGFRNFCITNEHPDGIVYCDPEIGGGEQLLASSDGDTPPPSVTISDDNESPPAAEVEMLSPPPSPPPSSSSSSSIVSCSPTNSPLFGSPCSSCSSVASGVNTIILTSSSDDDELLLDIEDRPRKEIKPIPDNKHEKKNVKDATNMSQDKVVIKQEAPNSSLASSSSTLKPGEYFGKTEAPPTPPQLVGNFKAHEGNVEDDTPQFLHHKKFHYKNRAVASSAPVAVPKIGLSTGKLKGQHETLQAGMKNPPPAKLSVDNLRLSQYITREQAENRLQAIGNLEETQREIDAFAALICTGAMYRMQMNNMNGNGSNVNSTAASSQNHLKSCTTAEASTFQNKRGKKASTSSSSSSAEERSFVSCTASTIPLRNSDDGGNGQKKARGHEGYFQVTSPGQASTSDDYEWISD